MSITIAVDVAKSICEVAVSDRPGRVVKRARLSRTQFARLLVTHPPATVLMEACGTAHFWGRHAIAHGPPAADAALPPALHPALAAVVDEIRDLEPRIHTIERQLVLLAATTPRCKRSPASAS